MTFELQTTESEQAVNLLNLARKTDHEDVVYERILKWFNDMEHQSKLRVGSDPKVGSLLAQMIKSDRGHVFATAVAVYSVLMGPEEEIAEDIYYSLVARLKTPHEQKDSAEDRAIWKLFTEVERRGRIDIDHLKEVFELLSKEVLSFNGQCAVNSRTLNSMAEFLSVCLADKRPGLKKERAILLEHLTEIVSKWAVEKEAVYNRNYSLLIIRFLKPFVTEITWNEDTEQERVRIAKTINLSFSLLNRDRIFNEAILELFDLALTNDVFSFNKHNVFPPREELLYFLTMSGRKEYRAILFDIVPIAWKYMCAKGKADDGMVQDYIVYASNLVDPEATTALATTVSGHDIEFGLRKNEMIARYFLASSMVNSVNVEMLNSVANWPYFKLLSSTDPIHTSLKKYTERFCLYAITKNDVKNQVVHDLLSSLVTLANQDMLHSAALRSRLELMIFILEKTEDNPEVYEALLDIAMCLSNSEDWKIRKTSIDMLQCLAQKKVVFRDDHLSAVDDLLKTEEDQYVLEHVIMLTEVLFKNDLVTTEAFASQHFAILPTILSSESKAKANLFNAKNWLSRRDALREDLLQKVCDENWFKNEDDKQCKQQAMDFIMEEIVKSTRPCHAENLKSILMNLIKDSSQEFNMKLLNFIHQENVLQLLGQEWCDQFESLLMKSSEQGVSRVFYEELVAQLKSSSNHMDCE